MWSTISSWACMYCVQLRGPPVDWNNIIFQIQAEFTCWANTELKKKAEWRQTGSDRRVSYATVGFVIQTSDSLHWLRVEGKNKKNKTVPGIFLFSPKAYLILFCTIWLTSRLTHTLHFQERTNHRRLFKIICFFYWSLHKEGVFEPGWPFTHKPA